MLNGSHSLILLAEDDEDDQELIRLAFTRAEPLHRLVIAGNGQELLHMLTLQPVLPCVILLDLNMPVLNGIQTLQALKREPRYLQVPKIILTTSDSEDNRKLSYSQGAADYLVKPSTMTEFVYIAQKILAYCH